ncbi:hypothetical protein [Photobacterium nomapromontoriensis]|uniref:hypothetical protein n=1 Tax=Photobacterium nomapromontoriensis TaxID=2910237 RepID=UPI003D0BD5F5
MKQIKAINPYMYKLLIEKEMDDFSVLEARDELVASDSSLTNLDEARRLVYRHIMSFERRGWLMPSGNGRAKKYAQSEVFKQLVLQLKPQQTLLLQDRALAPYPCSLMALAKEKKQHEGELAITLGEVEEYQSLIARFPENHDALLPLFTEAKERSAKLLGKMNALSNAIQTLRSPATASC